MANINLMSDLKQLVEKELSNLGYTNSIEADLDTLLMHYFNVINRLPAVIQWNIKQSQEVQQNIKNLPPNIKKGVNRFIQQAKSGKDLKPYISTRISDPDYKDLMLYDWGIFHFHLGINSHSTQANFVSRTNELLFAITIQNSMYLIDIHSHCFKRQKLLEIIENNWSEILEANTLTRVIGLPIHVSDNEIGRFRKAGIDTILETPRGRVIAPLGGGVKIAGESVESAKQRRQVNEIKNLIIETERRIIQQKEAIESYFNITYRRNWSDLVFKLSSFSPKIKIKEVTTNQIIPFRYE